MYDVIVVGAGPAGCRTAARLAGAGHHTLVLERHAGAGERVCCTGILGAECVNTYHFPEAVRLHAASSARLISPNGAAIHISRDSVQAYVIDRAAGDAWLATQAAAAGAEFAYRADVNDVRVTADGVSLTCADGTEYRGRAAVIASGYGRGFTERIGLGRCPDAVMGVQVEAPVTGVKEVEVHFGSAFAPGFFAWVVPLSADRARIGLIARRDVKRCLADFLAYIKLEGRLAGAPTPARYGGIPMRPLKQSYAPRLLAVGDAAGQAKPLTGGGVYYALLAADIAADVLDESLRRDDLSAVALAAYQRGWQRLLKRELDHSYTARRAFEHLSDGQISRIFGIIDRSGVMNRLAAAKDLSFDWHATVIRALAAQAVRSPRRTGSLLRALLPG